MDAETTTPDVEERTFLINDREYPVPSIWTFSLDELQVLWDNAKVTQDDFMDVPEDDPDYETLVAARNLKLKNPGVQRTIIHVAYQRGNPSVKPVEVKRLVGTVNLLEALMPMILRDIEEEQANAVPPTVSVTTSEPNGSSSRSSSLTDESQKQSTDSSGTSSTTGTDEPDTAPGTTGQLRSDTLPTLPPVVLAS